MIVLLVGVLFTGCASAGNTNMGITAHDGMAKMEASASEAWRIDDSEFWSGDTWENPAISGEEYDGSTESPFISVSRNPLSTFSSDVDTASYSNMRRYIREGMVPEGVRVEELVNYFDYGYERSAGNSEHPFAVTTEVGRCPWNEDNLLAMIGVQGAEFQTERRPASNIVFLIDVSGSMDEENKLPLLRESFKLLLEGLSKDDVISIVTYAGSDKIMADSVPGNQYSKLARVMDSLSAGGSTAGAQGLATAYELAENNFIEGGNNRIILATDGDFNVGPSSVEELKDMIELEREKGVFISVLGFGMYNLKDNKMETIANNGNGNYAYIDTIEEARKVLVDELDSTLYTIAKDLKLQVEFNPEQVAQYRLIGYNNRRLANEDFNDDEKDAGDVGAGHSVTAFYELVPAGNEGGDEDLIYQQASSAGSSDYMNIKIRYKMPNQSESRLMEQRVKADARKTQPSQEFGFASAVAEFGLILADSQYKAGSNVDSVGKRAAACRGEDPYGLRAEFLELVNGYSRLTNW